MRVQIFHNQNERESFLRGYEWGDHLICVYDASWKNLLGSPPSVRETLETIFSSNQHLDHQSPWYEGRSLSVGDVVVIAEEAYAVDRVGFKRIELPS